MGLKRRRGQHRRGEAIGCTHAFISAMPSSAVCFGLDELLASLLQDDARFYRDRVAML
jgi:hypothetical protein